LRYTIYLFTQYLNIRFTYENFLHILCLLTLLSRIYLLSSLHLKFMYFHPYILLPLTFFLYITRCLLVVDQVEQVELPFDKAKNQRRAFGFITFDSEEVVDKICVNAKIPYGDKMVNNFLHVYIQCL